MNRITRAIWLDYAGIRAISLITTVLLGLIHASTRFKVIRAMKNHSYGDGKKGLCAAHDEADCQLGGPTRYQHT